VIKRIKTLHQNKLFISYKTLDHCELSAALELQIHAKPAIIHNILYNNKASSGTVAGTIVYCVVFTRIFIFNFKLFLGSS